MIKTHRLITVVERGYLADDPYEERQRFAECRMELRRRVQTRDPAARCLSRRVRWLLRGFSLPESVRKHGRAD